MARMTKQNLSLFTITATVIISVINIEGAINQRLSGLHEKIVDD